MPVPAPAGQNGSSGCLVGRLSLPAAAGVDGNPETNGPSEVSRVASIANKEFESATLSCEGGSSDSAAPFKASPSPSESRS